MGEHPCVVNKTRSVIQDGAEIQTHDKVEVTLEYHRNPKIMCCVLLTSMMERNLQFVS